jgi:hypothetical protein
LHSLHVWQRLDISMAGPLKTNLPISCEEFGRALSIHVSSELKESHSETESWAKKRKSHYPDVLMIRNRR